MGGRAFFKTHGEAKRLDVETANKLRNLVLSLPYVHEVRELHCKTSFGDLDFVVNRSTRKEKLLSSVVQLLTSAGYNYESSLLNGNTYSTLFSGHQLDFIFVEDSVLQFAKNYYSDNDKGLLIGVTTKQLGFKYGHEGLYTKVGEKDFLLSKDTQSVLRFFKYSEDFVQKNATCGFNSYEELFDGLTSTPYFSPQYYNYENLNNENRSRNAKRKTYVRFLKYVSNKEYPVQIKPNKKLLLQEALQYFKVKEKYELELQRQSDLQLSKKYFNGNVVKKLTTLEDGRKLGNLMKNLKVKYPLLYTSAHTLPSEYIKSVVQYECFLLNQEE